MQISIFVSHVVGTALAWGIHAAWGVSDSSEQFVFLSGLALGSVFTFKAARDGVGAARADLMRRTFRLYRVHLMLFATFGALVITADRWLPLPGEAERLGWTWLLKAPWAAIPAAATMHWQPHFMGILPVFIWCMLLLAPFMWTVERAGAFALLLPGLAWVAVQAGWIATPSFGEDGLDFDPLAWQAIFLLGAFLGRRALLIGEAVPRHPVLLALAFLVILAGLWVRLVDHGMIPGPAGVAWALKGKVILAPTRLLHALSVAYLAAILLPRQGRVFEMKLASAVAAVGRHSLEVFCGGLCLAWACSLVLERWGSTSPWIDPLVVLGGVAMLVGLALALESRRAAVRLRVAAA